MKDKYIGIKHHSMDLDKRKQGSNLGLIFERLPNGKYRCINSKMRDFEEFEIKHDFDLGYIKELVNPVRFEA